MSQPRTSLTGRTGRAVGFRLGGNLASVGLGLGLGVILARILPPTEFGVFGVGLAIVTVADILGSGGMFQALIQRKDLRPEDESTGFALQLTGASALGLALVLFGPYLAAFFKMPDLGPLVQFQALALIIAAFNLVPSTRLNRRLAFDRLAVMEVSGRIAGGVVAIALGLQGKGALALTAGSLTTATVRTSLGWYFASGATPLHFSRQSARSLLGFGAGMTFIRAFNDLSHRVDVFIIGKLMGAGVVGLYQRAYGLMTIPLFQFTNAINQVLFPAMAKVQSDDERFRKGYLGSLGLSSMVAFPMLTLLWTTGDVLIPFLYGSEWRGAVPLLSLLCFVGYMRVVNNPNGLVTQSRAHVYAEGWRQFGFTVAMACAVLVGGLFWGITGAVIGVGVATLIYVAAMTALALSIARTSLVEWVSALRTTVLTSLIMALALLGLKYVARPFLPDFLLLAILGVVGMGVFLLSVRLLLSPSERAILWKVSEATPSRMAWLMRLVIKDRQPGAGDEKPHSGPARVLFCSDSGRVGGAERSLALLAAGLRDDFHTVAVVCPPGEYPDFLRRQGIKVIEAPLRYFKRGGTLLSYLRSTMKVWRLARENRADILHCNSYRAAHWGIPLALFLRRRVICHVRDSSYTRFSAFLMRLAPRSVRFIAVSQAVRQALLAIGVRPDRVDVAYNPVDVSNFHPGVPPAAFGPEKGRVRLGIFGRIEYRKRVIDAVEALARIPESAGAHLFVVGDAWTANGAEVEKELRDRIQELHLEDRVTMTGFQPDVGGLMAAMDVVLLPAENEPFARVVLEAMGMGKPVIAANSGGTPEMFENAASGILVPARSPVALAIAIERLASAPGLARSIGDNGRSRVLELFSLENHIRQVKNVYLKLLGSKPDTVDDSVAPEPTAADGMLGMGGAGARDAQEPVGAHPAEMRSEDVSVR